jgi:hypothetical protein
MLSSAGVFMKYTWTKGQGLLWVSIFRDIQSREKEDLDGFQYALEASKVQQDGSHLVFHP